MILFPAIDLKDGACVRLYKGHMEQATVFNHNPADQALQFERAGAEYLHVVDLNGAFEGRPVNLEAVKSILKAVTIPVQLGGGIRTIEMIETWLEAGIARVILGTVALRNPALVKEACKKFPGKVAVGIDARGGKVSVEGWAETSEMGVIELAKEYENAGVTAIIYTDADRDGAMEGPDFSGTKDLVEAVKIPIIASGGVSSISDLQRLSSLKQYGLMGVISGRAIYDGKIDMKEAIALLRAA